MGFREYASYDGLGLARLVARGEVTAAELVEEAIARAERLNPEINALVCELFDRAREAARKSDSDPTPRPFRGVPFLLKDLMGDLAGVPTTCGSRFLDGVPAGHDSELVLRFERAGFIPFGKTNTSEYGLLPTVESRLHGPCRNPWSLAHSSGGSSGGSAAAVAAGIVPVAHASDGGGSIRIPASCCGLVGLKPTRARNTLAPLLGDIMNGFVVEHAVSRSVRDSAAALDATAGPAVGDPYWAPPQARPYLEEVTTEPGPLRIAFTARNLRGEAVHPECRAAVERTAALCAELGHEVKEATPPIDPDGMTEAFFTIWLAGAAGSIDLLAMTTGRTPTPELFEPLTWAMYERGRDLSASDYQRAIAVTQLVARGVGAFFERHDALLTPTLEKPPLPLGAIDVGETDIERAFAPVLEYATFTPVFNATGQPAVSLPLHWTPDGLPVGVQLATRFGGEDLLFRLAGQLERARPWGERRPPVCD